MTEAVRARLAAVARRNRWNADALYAVVSLCTKGTFALDAGVSEWCPSRTCVGLLRFSEGTARRFGIEASPHPPSGLIVAATDGAALMNTRWATWAVACMGLDDQVELLERYLASAFERRAPRRPVDFYLAALGAAPGLPDATKLESGERDVGALRRELEGEMLRLRRASSNGLGDVLWTLLVMVLVRRLP